MYLNCNQVLVTQEMIHQKFARINHMSADAWNRGDQQARSCCDFTVLELIDMSDKYRPKPVDPLARAFATDDGTNPDPTRIQIGENTINLEEIKQDIGFLTNQDKDFVMNQLVRIVKIIVEIISTKIQDHRISFFKEKWENGTLVDTFVDNEIINPKDNTKFNMFIEHHRAATMAPVVFAEMVRIEQKLNQSGIKTVYLFPGYGQLVRWMKNRFGLMQEIPQALAKSGNKLYWLIIDLQFNKRIFEETFGNIIYDN